MTTYILQAIGRIQKVYVERGLVPRAERQQDSSALSKFVLPDSNFFELIPEADAHYENFTEIMFSITYQMRVGQRLRHRYYLRSIQNGTSDVAERNRQLLLLDFTKIYIDQLDKLLWPRWYTACFAKSYHSASSWANYGDGHKGVCLIFDDESDLTNNASTLELNTVTGWSSGAGQDIGKEHWSFVPFAFHDVSYSDKPGEVDFFRHISVLPRQALMELWYTDYDGETSECAAHVKDDADAENWRQNHWNDFRRDIVIKD